MEKERRKASAISVVTILVSVLCTIALSYFSYVNASNKDLIQELKKDLGGRMDKLEGRMEKQFDVFSEAKEKITDHLAWHRGCEVKKIKEDRP